MQQPLQNSTHVNPQPVGEELSFVKLHATLCFLMTQFHSHQCPKLAQFIVKHISLMVEHPEVAEVADARTLYLQLLQKWQNITGVLLEQRKMVNSELRTFH